MAVRNGNKYLQKVNINFAIFGNKFTGYQLWGNLKTGSIKKTNSDTFKLKNKYKWKFSSFGTQLIINSMKINYVISIIILIEYFIAFNIYDIILNTIWNLKIYESANKILILIIFLNKVVHFSALKLILKIAVLRRRIWQT